MSELQNYWSIWTEPDDAELLEIWEALPAAEKIYDNEQIDLDDFLQADGRLEVGGSLSLADIANMVTDENKDQEASDEEAVDAVQEEIISFQDAQKACFTLRKFMQQKSRGSDVMRACYLLDNEMHEIRRSNNRQMTIVECFGRR